MWGSATLAIEVSSTSMNVARVTVSAIIQGFRLGFQAATEAEGESGREPAAAALIPGHSLDTKGNGFDAQNTARNKTGGKDYLDPLLREPRRM
jgi:hypothetical protein